MRAGAAELARRSRGTPRIANRLLRRVRDYAEVRADGRIVAEVAARALDMLEVDATGLDTMDRKLLKLLIEKFDGGPVGIENLAAALSEERGTIEEVVEPYLIQQGYLMRTPPRTHRHEHRVAALRAGRTGPGRPVPRSVRTVRRPADRLSHSGPAGDEDEYPGRQEFFAPREPSGARRPIRPVLIRGRGRVGRSRSGRRRSCRRPGFPNLGARSGHFRFAGAAAGESSRSRRRHAGRGGRRGRASPRPPFPESSAGKGCNAPVMWSGLDVYV